MNMQIFAENLVLLVVLKQDLQQWKREKLKLMNSIWMSFYMVYLAHVKKMEQKTNTWVFLGKIYMLR